MRSALLLTLVLLLAGCLSPDAGPDGATAPDAAADGATPAAAVEPADGGAGPEAEGAANASAVIPLVFQGHLAADVSGCAFTILVGPCVDLPGESKNFLEITQTGTVDAFSLTLTWDASGPATENLNFGLYSEGEEFTAHAHAYGPSPLTLTTDGPFTLHAADTNYLYVGPPSYGGFALVAGAFVRPNPTEQPFSFEGSFTLVPS